MGEFRGALRLGFAEPDASFSAILCDQFDDSKLMPYPAGTFFSEVPNVPHFVAAKD
ncbi:hypothetical protein SAMN05444581_1211, partial [Methylocapsa palsarum]